MEIKRLAGLEPANVFGYFEKICSIPHGSRNTKAISDYLVSFAKEQGIRYEQDELNNAIGKVQSLSKENEELKKEMDLLKKEFYHLQGLKI